MNNRFTTLDAAILLVCFLCILGIVSDCNRNTTPNTEPVTVGVK